MRMRAVEQRNECHYHWPNYYRIIINAIVFLKLCQVTIHVEGRAIINIVYVKLTLVIHVQGKQSACCLLHDLDLF